MTVTLDLTPENEEGSSESERLMDEQAVRKDVLIAFEYSYKHDDWVYPLADALAGVTAAEAAWRPGTDLRGIWDIVLHMAIWTENIVERMRSGEDAHPAEGAWPSPPAIRDEGRESRQFSGDRRQSWDHPITVACRLSPADSP